MARELLQTISKDEIERAHFRSRRMFRMDMEHSLAVARDEGYAKGYAEGFAEGYAEGFAGGRAEIRIAAAKNQLKRNRPIDEIAEATGLTHGEVERLKQEN
jgi:predicted transposase/invertase (TIGR01784 family)